MCALAHVFLFVLSLDRCKHWTLEQRGCKSKELVLSESQLPRWQISAQFQTTDTVFPCVCLSKSPNIDLLPNFTSSTPAMPSLLHACQCNALQPLSWHIPSYSGEKPPELRGHGSRTHAWEHCGPCWAPACSLTPGHMYMSNRGITTEQCWPKNAIPIAHNTNHSMKHILYIMSYVYTI